MRVDKTKICDAICKSLVEFGYPDTTPAMIGEIYDAFQSGQRFPDLPHGVLGGFAESQLKDLEKALGTLP